jgi:Fe-S oxidoreductase
MMVEAKGAYVHSNGLRPTDWFMSRIDLLSLLASRAPHIANWALTNRFARWLMEKTMGLAQGRRLPAVARRSFLNTAARRRWTQPTRRSGPKVLYFVDTYANYFDPELAEALVAVFEHNGIAVFTPPGQKAGAMPLVAAGALEKARQIAAHNVAILAEGVRQGYTIVASEPSAMLCLKREYPMLLNDEDARQVAAHAMDACQYLWRLHQQGALELDFKPQPMTLGYHAPCHLKALEVGLPGVNLLRLIPGLTIRQVEKGCSGMAGTFGLKRENFRSSIRAGWGVISALRDERMLASATECSTCKMQIEQGTGKPAVHPLKVLALAYGLMPQVSQRIAHLPAQPVIS